MVSTKALGSDIEYSLWSNALSAKSILGGRVALTELRVVEENCLCGLKQFTVAVSKQGLRGCLIERPLNDFLNFIQHLKSNYMMYLLERPERLTKGRYAR